MTSHQDTYPVDTETAFAPLAFTGDVYYDDDDVDVDDQPASFVTTNNGNHGNKPRSLFVRSPSTGPRYIRTYRGGFATSLCDLFADPYDRSSCCALTCCGTLLQDRNTYVLTGQDPNHSTNGGWAWWLRLLVYGGVLAVICFWGAGLLWGTQAAVVSVVVVGLFLGCRNTLQRQRLRGHLLQLLHEQKQQQLARDQKKLKPHDSYGDDDHHDQDNDELFAPRHGLEHWTCGCVKQDGKPVLVNDNGNSQDAIAAKATFEYNATMKRRQQSDLCRVIWHNILAKCCCQAICNCWCQCCGMCATAQEDRELRRLFPKETFYMDYVTLQPYADYYPTIQWLRQQAQEHEEYNDHALKRITVWNHLAALSKLSQKLLFWLQLSIVVLLIAATLHLVEDFSVPKVIVVVATLAQAGIILYVVYWRSHRNDISLDAVIKYFASGFVLAMTVAMVVEVVLDMIGTIIFTIVLTNQYVLEHPELLDDPNSGEDPFADVDIFQQIAVSHYGTFLVYLLFKGLIVASLVEELTKYFCFWMVEHPDFIFSDGVGNNDDEHEANENQLVLHESTASHRRESIRGDKDQQGDAVSVHSTSSPRPASNVEEAAEDNDNIGDDDHVEEASGSAMTASTAHRDAPMLTSPIMEHRTAKFRPRSPPRHSSLGAAITVAMVATAAGFSCCENLMYVFSQTSLAGEITVLVARSALPVHSVCAAIQSIGIVRRDVEQDASYGLGWSILPAVIVHGLFDFSILALAFYLYVQSPAHDDMFATTPAVEDPVQQQQRLEQQAAAEMAEQLYGFALGAGITVFALIYYFVQARKQRHRLNALEMTTAVPMATVGRQIV